MAWALGSFALLVVLGAFISWSFDIGTWSVDGRTGLLLAWFMFMIPGVPFIWGAFE